MSSSPDAVSALRRIRTHLQNKDHASALKSLKLYGEQYAAYALVGRSTDRIVTGDSIAVRSNCTHTWPGKRAGMTCSECIDKPKPAQVVRVYDDRGRIIGWKCEGCKQSASYLSQLRHLEGCDYVVELDRA